MYLYTEDQFRLKLENLKIDYDLFMSVNTYDEFVIKHKEHINKKIEEALSSLKQLKSTNDNINIPECQFEVMTPVLKSKTVTEEVPDYYKLNGEYIADGWTTNRSTKKWYDFALSVFFDWDNFKFDSVTLELNADDGCVHDFSEQFKQLKEIEETTRVCKFETLGKLTVTCDDGYTYPNVVSLAYSEIKASEVKFNNLRYNKKYKILIHEYDCEHDNEHICKLDRRLDSLKRNIGYTYGVEFFATCKEDLINFWNEYYIKPFNDTILNKEKSIQNEQEKLKNLTKKRDETSKF